MCSLDFINRGDMPLFMLFQINPAGLRSGEYGGGNVKFILSFLAVFLVFFSVMRLKLSKTIMIPPLGLTSRICPRNFDTDSFLEFF